MTLLKIASWNINSVRLRIDSVKRFLAEEDPDILCLQETKAENAVFPSAEFAACGYPHVLLNGQKMYHGVAIISKIPLVDAVCHNWHDESHARHIGARLPNGWRLETVYIPAGGDIPDRDENPKFGQKLDFLARMTEWSTKLATPTLMVGDFNIAPLESDVWGHKELLKTVSHTPLEVETLARLQASHGWVDLGRHFVPAPARLYTWWSYRAKDWTVGDRGRRLDHMWASPKVAAAARLHRVCEPLRSWEKPSDHVPLITGFEV